jgi:hypothetical protein
VDIVNVSGRREFKPSESFQIRQTISIKVDVIETGTSENACKSRCAKEEANEALRPRKSSQPGPAYSPNRCPGAH